MLDVVVSDARRLPGRQRYFSMYTVIHRFLLAVIRHTAVSVTITIGKGRSVDCFGCCRALHRQRRPQIHEVRQRSLRLWCCEQGG